MDGRETMRRTGSPVQGEDLLDCWERDRNYPPEFFCQIHGDNSSHDTSDGVVLRKEFVMLYPEFMEYRRRRLGAAAPIGGRGSGRGMYYPHRQQPRLDSGASWSRGRPPPPPQRAGSGPGGHNGRHPGGRGFEDYRLYQPGGRSRGGGDYYEGYSPADPDAYRLRYYSEPYDNSSHQQQQQQQQIAGRMWCTFWNDC